MSRMNVTEAILGRCDAVSQVLKSLSHPVRLKVLCFVMDGEKSVNELTDFCGISQSAMSQFLNRMRLDGIVSSRKDGTHVYYGIGDANIVKLLRAIREIYC